MRHFEYYNDKIVTPRDRDTISICKMREGRNCHNCTNKEIECEVIKLKFNVQKPMEVGIDAYK